MPTPLKPRPASAPGSPTAPRSGPSLAVFVDGVRLPPDEGRAFWARFSAYMEEHKGDLGGFAKAEGFASVRPEMSASGASLVVSRSAAQVAYTNVSSERDEQAHAMDGAGSARGSPAARARPSPSAKKPPNVPSSSKKRR